MESSQEFPVAKQRRIETTMLLSLPLEILTMIILFATEGVPRNLASIELICSVMRKAAWGAWTNIRAFRIFTGFLCLDDDETYGLGLFWADRIRTDFYPFCPIYHHPSRFLPFNEGIIRVGAALAKMKGIKHIAACKINHAFWNFQVKTGAL